MSKLLKLLYDVADIRCRYHRIHEDLLGFSARRLWRAIHRTTSDASLAPEAELDRLLVRLDTALEELDELTEDDLSVRRGDEVRNALRYYAEALSESSSCLKALCTYSRRTDVARDSDESNALKVAYDDAVQYQKRLGKRLNELIASL